jgi:hypothetical protein
VLVQRPCGVPLSTRAFERHTSGPGRDAYVREDQVLAHLQALHLMRTGEDTAPDQAGALARLHADGIELVYDQAGRTVTADTAKKERIAIGR